MIIELFTKDGRELAFDAANDMHEAGKIIGLRKDQAIKFNPGLTESDIEVWIDGDLRNNEPPVDVRRIASNMKSARYENQIMGDLHI